MKDINSYSKNVLHIHDKSSEPVLCFSIVLVTSDNHLRGRSLGSDPKEWVLKDVAGVMLAMELERLVAVLGLAYDLPYVPDDNLRKQTDLLHFPMIENAFSFTTGMMAKNGECTWDILYYVDTNIFNKRFCKGKSQFF